jgi:CheY-like chemotaxis protein
MMIDPKPRSILVAEDDPDDRQWIKDALAECHLGIHVDFVTDGEELMDFLQHRGKYVVTTNLAYPGLVLLDLNMPKKDGRESLREIKTDPRLRHIPIVVLTTSRAEEDTFRTYDIGANSVIHKPVTFDNLVQIMQTLTDYWFKITELPL